jgi:hypothetical protein
MHVCVLFFVNCILLRISIIMCILTLFGESLFNNSLLTSIKNQILL